MKKMMRNKLTAFLLGGIIAGSFIVPLAACIDNTPPPEDNNSDVVLTQKDVTVEWKKVDGAVKYKVYHSPSRFGTYTLESTQTECKYTSQDRFGYFRVEAVDGKDEVKSSQLYSYEIETFGNNTHIYAPTDNQTLVQEDVDRFMNNTSQFADKEIYEQIWEQNENGEWIKTGQKLLGEGRYAGLFKAGKSGGKGVYNDLNLRMRYYMTFSGLGYLPTDVELGGFYTRGELSGGNATCNFWCGIDNMTVNSNVQWAVSQATSFRRMKVNGNLTLHDTGSTPWASGGFISDTVVTGTVDGSVQQQWFTRNSDWGKWSGGDINMVFAGCSGKLSDYRWGSHGNGWVTYLPETKVMSEKPYLVFDDDYYVCVPALQKNSSGISWDQNGKLLNANDVYLPLSEFYVARSDRDNSATINAALKDGKNILFTPGIYEIDSPILVENPETIVMGIGLASLRLTSKNTDTIMRISDVDGVRLSGIMFDAGPSSKTLLQIGTEKTDVRHNNNPTILNDVYYRIGGAGSAATSVDTTLEINANDVVGDNFWVWRADHGNRGTVGWDINKTKNGVIVNGDYVTIYGLMVEHFHEYQTIWNGEYGYMAFYQSETPYDVDMEYVIVPDPTEDDPDRTKIQYTTQNKWMSEWNGNTYQGYASYKVSDSVINHEAYGLGVYYVASGSRTFILDHGIEAPANKGIHIEHMAIANFSSNNDRKGVCGITHIINDQGDKLYVSDGSKNHFNSYINGQYTKN